MAGAADHVSDHPHIGLQRQLVGAVALNQFDAECAQLVAHGRINASIAAGEPLDIGHMVSGNRIRTNGVIKVGLDDEWRGLSAVRRVGYYLACLPLQLINRYRL